ncbi:expressed protein [Dictyostelium purpureum]|uniref:Autophagy-related protein 27 n=1 Tax=Dictyostelium purpureum TaxID=5786 RepID=F0ZQ52_DICPU|nr:uncharacterized protein DICPUDRAFT_98404 [Dictyostelium purpureum]EGC33908.1 expressed protein [Dictyostelium purpureum]|eukprot:XP_003289543.1 expressed protein [Dictyostelium purpureum]
MRLFITVFLALLSISQVFADSTCIFQLPDNRTLDFSALDLSTVSPYVYNVPDVKNTTITFNFCGEASYCTSKDPGSSICSTNSTSNTILSFGSFSRGTANTAPLPSDISGTGIQLKYSGDPKKTCGPSGTRNSYLNLVCADVSAPQVVSAITPWGQNGVVCQITLQINVPCPGFSFPKKNGLGGGWIFIIILLSGSAAYIIFGSIVNWKIRRLQGSHIFPNVDFWKGFGSLIKDGCGFIKGKITGTPGGEYSQI